MADETVSVDLSGWSDVIDKINALPVNVQTRILNAAMRGGAATIAAEAQQRAPVLKAPSIYRVQGLLRANIAVRKMAKRRIPAGMATGYSVGVLGGAAEVESDTRKNRRKGINGQKVEASKRPFYWRYLEFGTEQQPAQPFLRPAFDAKKLAAIEAVRVYLTANLYKAIAT